MGTWRVVFAACLLALFAPGAQASEFEIPWERLRETANCYLDHFCPEKDRAAMTKKLKERAAQKIADREMNEDQAMREVMLEWAVANDGRLQRREKKAVHQACFYFVSFIDKGYLIPNVIRSRLTEKVVGEIFEYLDGEIVKAEAAKGGAEKSDAVTSNTEKTGAPKAEAEKAPAEKESSAAGDGAAKKE